MRARKAILVLLTALATTAAAASTSSAGACLDDEEIAGYMTELEAYARSKKPPDDTGLVFLCLHGQAKYTARITKACQKVLDKNEPKDPMHTGCVELLASFKLAKLGEHDIVALLLATKLGVLDAGAGDRLRALGELRDPRAAPVVIDIYRQFAAKATSKPPTGWRATAWVEWRKAMLKMLRTLADPSTRPFIDEFIANTKDKKLLKLARQVATKLDQSSK